MKDFIIKQLDNLIYGIISLTIFLVPLYFSFFYSFGTGFLINLAIDKTVIFKVLVLVLFFFTFVKISFVKKINLLVDKKLVIAIFIFFSALILSTIFSIDPNTSIYGTYWRQQGLITNLYYFLFFPLLIINIKDRKQVEKIISVLLLSSFFVSLIGVLGWFKIDPLSLMNKNISRAVSTIGQPVFLGNFLVLTIFLAIYKIKISSNFWFKFLYFICLLFQFFCLIFTYSRGAWLAFFIGILCLLFFHIYFNKKKLFFPIFVSLVVCLIIFVSYGIYTFGSVKALKELSIKNRIESYFSYKTDSASLRIKYWTAALDLIKSNPLLGYGLENQRTIFLKYYDRDWMVYEDINSYVDRAHNEYLDFILTSGLVGLFAFYWFFYLLSKQALVYVNSNGKNKELISIIMLSLIAYLVSLFFSFSTTETSIIFWLYVALLYLLINDFKKNLHIDLASLSKVFSVILYCFLLFFILIIPLQIYNEINKIKADFYFSQAVVAARTRNYKNMLNNYFKALVLNNNEYYRTAFLTDLVRSDVVSFSFGGQKNESQKTVDLVKSIIREDEKLPVNYFRNMRKALYFTYLGRYENGKYFEQAENIHLNIIKDYPNLPDSYNELANSYYLRKDYLQAIDYYEKALNQLPNLNHPELNIYHKQNLIGFSLPIYKNIASAYLALGKIDQGLEYLQKALKLNIYDPELYHKLSDVYFIKDDKAKAIDYAKTGLKLFPWDSSWTYSLAYLFKENGEFEIARIYLDKAKKMPQPTMYKQDFLEKIEKDLPQ